MIDYSLQLFKLLLDKKPAGLAAEVGNKAEEEYERLQSEAKIAEEVEEAMIVFGKQAWPYWQAELEFMEKYGKSKEMDLFLENLSDDLRAKWQLFEDGGGDMHDYRQAEGFEEAFSADEDHIISEALIKAKQTMRKNVKILAQEKADEYNELVKKYQAEEEEILGKLEELRQLKETGDKWDEEIDKEIYFFEKGLAELEERPTVEKVQGKIDWYQGQIEVGNK